MTSQVEICRPLGDADKPRAWSKYAKDSSAYGRAHKEEERVLPTPSTKSATSKTADVDAQRLANDRRFSEFASIRGQSDVVDKVKEKVGEESDEEGDEEEKGLDVARRQLRKELLDGVNGESSVTVTLTIYLQSTPPSPSSSSVCPAKSSSCRSTTSSRRRNRRA